MTNLMFLILFTIACAVLFFMLACALEKLWHETHRRSQQPPYHIMNNKPSESQDEPIKLWLDDVRRPPDGWWHVKTVNEAKQVLLTHKVSMCSLDHDLGACEECLNRSQFIERTPNGALVHCMPNCPHFGTGYDLVRWMEDNEIWPMKRVLVHSMNPGGRLKMEQVISRKYGAL